MTPLVHIPRTICLAALASLALSAILATGAQAGQTWAINGSKLAAGGSATCQGTTDGTMTLESEVLGAPFLLTWTDFGTDGCKVVQSGSGASAVAEMTFEKITLGGLTVVKPSCEVKSPLATTALKALIVTPGSPAATYLTISPASGTTLGNVVLSGCAAAETYPLKGSVCIDIPSPGEFAIEKTQFADVTSAAACSSDGLTLGGKKATMLGSFKLDLTGANTGKSWGYLTT